jgi:hypothetical protein
VEVDPILIDSGAWLELFVPTPPFDDVAWAVEQGQALAALLAQEHGTKEVRVTTVAPGESCPLPGSQLILGKAGKTSPHRFVVLAMPNSHPKDLDLFALLSEEVAAFQHENHGDEDNDEQAEEIGEDDQPDEDEPSADDEEAAIAEQSAPRAERPQLAPVSSWDTVTACQVLAGVLIRHELAFRVKERDGELYFELEECPCADVGEGNRYRCYLVVRTDGTYGVRCLHNSVASWSSFKALIGWQEHARGVRRALGIPPRSIPYRTTESGLVFLLRLNNKRVVRVPLCNFNARILRDVEEDDGVETRHTFEIEATLDGQTRRFTLPAAQFAAMNWPLEYLGARAVIHVAGSKPHLRAAIQVQSTAVVTETVYKHLGWRPHEGKLVYLHGQGGIGEHGAVPGVRVALPEQLSRYRLPTPPQGTALRDAIRASLRILEVAADAVTIPLYAGVWRSILGGADFGLHLVGPSGEGKSTFAVLLQQHWGAELDAQHIPASWLSTANANELLAFTAKDALLLVDDFVPAAGGAHSTRKDQEADRLFRGQGNSAGRSRLRSDATLQLPKPPRGLILSTGEATPRGLSVRARILTVEMSQGGLDWERATACQKDAGEGHYAAALAGYLHWLAPQLDEVRKRMPGRLAGLREQATASGLHKRTPGIVANLAFALELFTAFAVAAKAMTPRQAEAFQARCWKALGEAAAAQPTVQAHGESAQRFLGLLRQAIATGQAHLAGPDGQAPAQPSPAGWQQDGDTWSPRGDLIGWLDGADLYLEPDRSYTVAQRIGQERHEPLGVGDKGLHKRLHEQHSLASTDQSRGRLTMRKTLGGKVRTVLHLRAESLLGQASPAEATAPQPQEK